MPETVSQFAARIKSKYPQYAQIDDAELVRRILEKYPQYADMVQQPGKQKEERSFSGFVANVPRSAGRFATDVAGAVAGLSPISLEEGVRVPPTIKAVGELGLGAAELLIPGEQGHEDMARAVGEHYMSRYGSLEKIGETFYNDPVGMAADVATLMSGAGVAAKGAQTAATAAKLGKVAKVAEKAVGTGRRAAKATDPIQGAARAAKGVRTAQRALTGKVKNALFDRFPELKKLTTGENKILSVEKALGKVTKRDIATMAGGVGLGTGDITTAAVTAAVAALLRNKAFRTKLTALIKQVQRRESKGRIGKALPAATPLSRIEAFLDELEKQEP